MILSENSATFRDHVIAKEPAPFPELAPSTIHRTAGRIVPSRIAWLSWVSGRLEAVRLQALRPAARGGGQRPQPREARPRPTRFIARCHSPRTGRGRHLTRDR